MAIQGLRNTGILGGGQDSNDFVADQRPLDWRTGILLLYPNGKAPLTALTSQMKKKVANDPEFNWWDKQLKSQRYVLTTAIDGVTTTIVCAGGGLKEVRIGHVIVVEETGEIVRVTGTTSDTSIEVERGAAGSTAASLNPATAGNNPHLLVIGSAFEEGSQKPQGLNYDPTKRTNFTQIFRWNIGATRTATKTHLRTGDQVKEAKREALEYYSIEMEKAFWWGKQFEEAVGGVPRRYTGGFLDFIDPARDWTGVGGSGATRVKDWSTETTPGQVNMDDFEFWLKDCFEYGSSEKVAFMGNLAMLVVHQLVRKSSNYQIFAREKEYGMNISRLVTPFGEVVMKTHPLWTQNTSGMNGISPYFGQDSWMAIVDMASLTYRPLKDSDTKYMPNQETPGQDGFESGYIGECGMEFAHPITHGISRAMASAA